MTMSTRTRLDAEHALAFSERVWEGEILPALAEYIRIPNQSQGFDRAWREHGHMERAVALIEALVPHAAGGHPRPGRGGAPPRGPRAGHPDGGPRHPPPGGGATDTVLLYGHLDKQPEMTGWREGLAPWSPVREGDRLYGRGGADDGYSAFASLAALRLLHEQGVPHARAWSSSRPARRAAAPICPPTSRRWRRASASRAWWCASTRGAATTISSGRRPRCAA